MASENAKLAARKVLETIRKGGKIHYGKILQESGYTKATSTVPTQVTRSKSYQDEVKPIVDRWRDEIARIQTELEKKSLDKERYEVLVTAMDKINKQVQLATGGATEHSKIVIVFDDSFKAREIQINETSRSTKADSP
jgi:hypothetical protein